MFITLQGNHTLDELVHWLEQNIGYRTVEKRSYISGPGWSITPSSLPMEGVARGIRIRNEWVVIIDDEQAALLFKLRWM